MGSSKSKIKNGMAGSNGGRNRYEKTAVLKNDSKGRRREEGKSIIRDELANSQICKRCYFFRPYSDISDTGSCLFWIPFEDKKIDDTCKRWRKL